MAQTLTIPRAVAVVAGGSFHGDPGAAEIELEVRAGRGEADWGIAQSPFMRDNASTEAFEHKVTLRGDCMTYAEKTHLQIYGRSFEHTDQNDLRRVRS